MPRPQTQFDTREVAVICNIGERTWMDQQPYGNFVVQGTRPGLRVVRDAKGEITQKKCAPGEEYSLTEITGRDQRVDQGDNPGGGSWPNSRLEYMYAMQIAEDLTKRLNGDGGTGSIAEEGDEIIQSYFGLFVCKGNKPTEEELAEAHAKLERYYRARVATADSNWEQTHNPIFVDSVDRRAARYLKLNDKPWLFDTKPMKECPVCSGRIKATVAVCLHCGAILDKEIAAQYGLVAPEGKVKREPKEKAVA